MVDEVFKDPDRGGRVGVRVRPAISGLLVLPVVGFFGLWPHAGVAVSHIGGCCAALAVVELVVVGGGGRSLATRHRLGKRGVS